MRLKIAFLLLAYMLASSLQAQIKWRNPLKESTSVVQNQGWTEERNYARLPLRMQDKVRPPLWKLSRHSTGLAIHFYTNATNISVRYQVSEALAMRHMPSTGVSGVDLYRVDEEGKTAFCFGGYPTGDTIRYKFRSTGKAKYHKLGFEYRLFLPLHNEVEWLEIGVDAEDVFSFVPASAEKPIVVYGTSIVQGSCASRPGMAWTNILQRALDCPLLNLGFAGEGKLEEPILDLMAEKGARLYILDCQANIAGETEASIRQKTLNAVRRLRQKSPAPILLVEHAGVSNMQSNADNRLMIEKANRASLAAYKQLKKEGVKGLFYQTREELDRSAEAFVDRAHPSDLGMAEQAKAVEAAVRKILSMPVGKLHTQQPITQRREPGNYEWLARHRAIVERNRTEKPRALFIGNSITHYWGGAPFDSKACGTGADSWEKYMQSAGYANMGCGWDRIENVLWRVYHGELDGFDAEEITLLLGTNNKGLNTDHDIVEGLRFLVQQIKVRQPQAKIRVLGILPRRNGEAWCKRINQDIARMAEECGAVYQDLGSIFLMPNGKIDEKLFRGDGLHPNAKAYMLMAKELQ